MTASPYSSTALSAEDITFLRTDGNPLLATILCIVKKTKAECEKHAVAIIYDSFH